MSEWQQQVGHRQAEFNKQKHMCPAVPLAFPWSRVWVANLGRPGVSAADLYQSRKLLTSGTSEQKAADIGHLRGSEMPSCTHSWRCWKGEVVGTKCVIPAPALWDDGKELQFSPSLQLSSAFWKDLPAFV